MDKSQSRKPGISDEEIEATIDALAGDVFELFKETTLSILRYYWLTVDVLSSSIQDAATHLDRAGVYHSTTGANVFKKAAYIAKAIAFSRPVQIARVFPVNLSNQKHLEVLRINANFAVYALEALLGVQSSYPRLLWDIRYCFEFRPRMDEDAVALLLEHALQHSPQHFAKSS